VGRQDTELIQYATEIKVRAERRCGDLLANTERAQRGDNRYTVKTSDAATSKTTLSDMGLTRDESSRYQQLAAMPDEHFECEFAYQNTQWSLMERYDVRKMLHNVKRFSWNIFTITRRRSYKERARKITCAF
jgi:hypothetical protein